VPTAVSKGMLATFCPPKILLERYPSLELLYSIDLATLANSPPSIPSGWHHGDLRRSVSTLLNLHWRLSLERRGAHQYVFSQGAPAVYHTLGNLGLARVSFSSPVDASVSRSRQLMGYKTVAGGTGGEARRRYWHFALEARAETDIAYGYVMRPHVLFGDDGHNVWSDEPRLHRARRAQ
jgi:hypothetical protein